MKILMTDIGGKNYSPYDITEITLTDTLGAACSSLCFKFKDRERTGEIVEVKAYEKDKIIFNGFCDCQRITANSNGYECYIYARSSASLLVDSQAKPFTFNCPSARQLWSEYARDLGFSYNLPEIFCREKYEISSGTSCFGAINNFAEALTGNEIYINPQNQLCLREKSRNVENLGKYKIISACAVINRSEPVSHISYKREQDNDYCAHMKSDFVLNKNISRTRYINLNSVAQWQRENTVYQKLKNYLQDYMVLEVTVSGAVSQGLCQRFDYSGEIGEFKDYILCEKKYSFDDSGEKTRLTLRKSIDMGDVIYVD